VEPFHFDLFQVEADRNNQVSQMCNMIEDLNSKLESAQQQESLIKSERDDLIKKQDELKQTLDAVEKSRIQFQTDLDQEKIRSAAELAEISEQLSTVKAEVQAKISQAESQVKNHKFIRDEKPVGRNSSVYSQHPKSGRVRFSTGLFVWFSNAVRKPGVVSG
jgi:uncharacterized phage infection (PIP) family protein YhgE